jgi:soluble lytic murein transglycosylase
MLLSFLFPFVFCVFLFLLSQEFIVFDEPFDHSLRICGFTGMRLKNRCAGTEVKKVETWHVLSYSPDRTSGGWVMSKTCVYLICFFLVTIVSCLPATSWGDIYKYVDANGVIHFTNIPTGGRYSLYLKEENPGDAGGKAVKEIISRYCRIFNLEEALVRAVIKVESDYNPRAISSKGALGIMQLLPQTAQEMKVEDPLNPEENICGGSRYLRLMLDRFGDNLDLALAAYNAGPGTVCRHGGIPPYEETRNYVDRVKKYLQYYRKSKDMPL